jgi:hypothetical protein
MREQQYPLDAFATKARDDGVSESLRCVVKPQITRCRWNLFYLST